MLLCWQVRRIWSETKGLVVSSSASPDASIHAKNDVRRESVAVAASAASQV